jgi:phage/plasmid-associated DNA primase
MNEAPRIANTTSGIFRRVKIVEFPALKRLV